MPLSGLPISGAHTMNQFCDDLVPRRTRGDELNVHFIKIRRDDCDTLTGDTRLGQFLYRLVRWQPHTRVHFKGYRWVAWPRVRWEKELNLSRQQFRLVLEKMTAKNLIVREQHIYGGSTPVHIRLSDECLQLLANIPRHPSVNGPKQPIGDGLTHPSLYKNTLKEHFSREPKSAVDCVDTPSPSSNPVKSFEEDKKESERPDIRSEKKAKSCVAGIDLLKADQPSTLVHVWQAEHAAKGLTFSLPTKKDFGQFKRLIVACPAGTAPDVVRCAVQNWTRLVETAENDYAAFKSPTLPELGYLVRFVVAAISLHQRLGQKPVQSIAVGDAKPMTLGEIYMAKLAKDLAGKKVPA